MTNDLPAYVTWPVLLLMAGIVGVRYRWFNRSRLEHYLNNALFWLLTANVLRDRTLEGFLAERGYLSMVTAHQLSLAAAVLSASEFLLFIGVWAGQEMYGGRRTDRLRRMEAVAVVALLLVTGTPARRAGQTLEAHESWWSVAALGLLCVYFTLLSTEVIRMALRERRHAGHLRPRDKAVIWGLIAIAGVIAATSVGGFLGKLLDRLDLMESTEDLHDFHGHNFFIESIVEFGLAAVPLALMLSRLGAMDHTSRNWRALQPLRRDLEAVVPPAVTFPDLPTRRKSHLDLHLADVAIHDSILQLRPYFRDVAPEQLDACRHHGLELVPGQRRYAEMALQVADALAARAAGEAPPSSPAPSVLEEVDDTVDLEDDIAEVLHLARWWKPATAVVARDRRRAARASGDVTTTGTRIRRAMEVSSASRRANKR